mgnify:CR=1 FL=1
MKKLLVLFVGLFIMVNGAVFAQETDDKDGSQDGYVMGSVSNNSFYSIPANTKLGGIQPLSVSGVDYQVRLSWYYHTIFACGGLIRCSATGYANTQIVGSVPEITICAQVTSLLKNGANQGSSGQTCLYYTTSGNASNDITVFGDPRGAYWVANTSHIVIGPGVYENPHLQASVSL